MGMHMCMSHACACHVIICAGAGSLASPLPSPGEVEKSGARVLFPAGGEGLPAADVAIVHDHTTADNPADNNSATPVNRPRDAPNTTGSVKSSVTSMPAPPASKSSGATIPSPLDRDSEVGAFS